MSSQSYNVHLSLHSIRDDTDGQLLIGQWTLHKYRLMKSSSVIYRVVHNDIVFVSQDANVPHYNRGVAGPALS